MLSPNPVFLSSWPFDPLPQYLAVIQELWNQNVGFNSFPSDWPTSENDRVFVHQIIVSLLGAICFSGSENPACFLSSLFIFFARF